MSQQERAARTQSALIRSAAEQFERHGYEKASLNDISSGAGVSRGALHFHFDTKADVADAVENAAARALRDVVDSLPSGDTCALQNLTDLSHSLVKLLLWDVVVRAGFLLSCDAGQRGRADLCRNWQTYVHGLVARAVDEKSLAPGVAPEGVVNAVVTTTVGLVVLSRSEMRWLTDRPLTSFWRVLLPAVADPRIAAGLNPGGTGAPYELPWSTPDSARATAMDSADGSGNSASGYRT
ncbi:ScbR family autoregulator-binding transcription factor [Streptomyces sp. B-S-A8]|uniref:ScbR family autoregulator-binding transcription factor n=1 Tax=Streptomyces solicavernae TaxID=3043614 RepID=A0ABT6RZJ8_9ACTN|nr:ScbR family autoregulator-binding transcription factor [Streptomyces sp. B-S-A8]MDI3389868.1 ScbR family autoregulator-binding transcription factor [Streptomyces sp. B-S-A8]